jgi:hypothetical protein
MRDKDPFVFGSEEQLGRVFGCVSFKGCRMTREEQVWLQAYLAAAKQRGVEIAHKFADQTLIRFQNRFPTEPTPQKECTKVEHQGLIDTEAMFKAWGKYYFDQSYGERKREPVEMDFKNGFIAALRYARGEK